MTFREWLEKEAELWGQNEVVETMLHAIIEKFDSLTVEQMLRMLIEDTSYEEVLFTLEAMGNEI